MKIIANKIAIFHDISLAIKFFSTASGNSLTTKYAQEYLNKTESNSNAKKKTSTLLIATIKSPPNISFQSYYKCIFT